MDCTPQQMIFLYIHIELFHDAFRKTKYIIIYIEYFILPFEGYMFFNNNVYIMFDVILTVHRR